MHVTILAIGSRGDVQPYVALGHGLQQAGYRVRLGAPGNFETLATEHGLDFVAISPSSQQIMAGPVGQAMMTTGQNNAAFVFKLAEMVGAYAQASLLASWQACQGTDAIIFNHFGWMGYHIAERLNLPAVAAWIYPLSRTRFMTPFGIPDGLSLGRLFNPLSFLLFEQVTQLAFARVFKEWRQTLELPPLPRAGIFHHFYRRHTPVLYAYSPRVCPKPADWPERFVVTGYWFLERPTGWQPPAALLDFLAAGPPPVYIGFGSMSGSRSGELVTVAVEALKRSGRRGILARGWGGLPAGVVNQPLTDDIFVVEAVPHDWLFPQMAAVVHHGGAGTTAAGLRAGVPSILTPFSGDQPFWGRRVAALEVGPAAISYHRLSARRLAGAIEAAGSAAMQQRAAALGRHIRAENGVAGAVAALQKFI